MNSTDWETFNIIDYVVIIGVIYAIISGYKEHKNGTSLNHVHHRQNKSIMSYGRPIGYSKLPGRRKSKFSRVMYAARTGKAKW